MINYIWFFIIFIGVIVGLVTGKGELLSTAIINSTSSSVNLIIGLVGMMCLWCGVIKIAERSGLTDIISRLLKPVLRLIFTDISKDDKVLGAVVMNISSNMMGLSNAATPFGIKAMEEMEKQNKNKGTASNDMALFLVLNAVCIQFIPTSIISLRAASGSHNPAIIIIPALITTTVASIFGIIYCKILQRYF
ncbi:MAG: nucleoside recognition domain-containing protein [Clostridiaceae bacterium]